MIQKIRIITIFCFLLICCSIGNARPPSTIELAYDHETAILSIDVKHVSHNVYKHYTRRLFVYKNEILIKTFAFVRQERPMGFSLELPLVLVEGDHIVVKTICSVAGRKEQLLVIEQKK